LGSLRRVLVLAALSAQGAGFDVASGPALLPSLGLLSFELLELELLLLESVSYIGGGVWVGNGCSSAAVECGFAGVGASEVSLEGRGFAGSPGKGNCWAAGGACFWSAGGTQGLSVAGLPVVWLGGGHGGVSVGFGVDVVWAMQATEHSTAASMA
jgi:hypothetical protein